MPFTGSCHCGAIRYTVDGDAPTSALQCNCSICRRKAALHHFTTPDKFTLHTSREAVATYQFNNHTVRSPEWRYIRYHDGGEELYDERKDPLEWTNVASKPELASVKAELAKAMPTKNTPEMKRATPATAPANPTSPAERRRQRQAARREAE